MKYFLAAFLTTLLISPAVCDAQGKAEAKQRFNKGVKLFNKGDNVGALVEFQAAYEAEPHFKVRYNIGMTLYNLNRYVEAEEELKAYLLEGGDKVKKNQKLEVQGILYEILGYIGTVTFLCDVDGAQVWVDGVFAATLPMSEPLRLDVGEHLIEVKADGYQTSSAKVSVPGGKDKQLKIELAPAGAAPGVSTGPTTGAPPPGSECTYDGHCRWPTVCHQGKCMSKKDKKKAINAAKHKPDPKTRGLLIGGAVSAGIGTGPFVIGLIFMAAFMPKDDTDMSIAGLSMFVPGLVLSGVGYALLGVGIHRYKRWKRENPPPQPKALLLPYVTPIEGGAVLGLGGYF